MTTDHDKPTICAARIDDTQPPPVTLTFTNARGACSRCAAPVWLDPSSVKWRDAGAQVLCIECLCAVLEAEFVK